LGLFLGLLFYSACIFCSQCHAVFVTMALQLKVMYCEHCSQQCSFYSILLWLFKVF
jgi:hypothetical protein